MDLGLRLWVGSAVAVIWAVFLIASRRRYNALPRVPIPEHPDPVPDCMVVIPARNEAKSIARAVASLPPDTVIVIDDHSEDDTAKVAAGCGAGVIPAPPLPRNGIGKANACAAGARVLTSRWVLFADADTWYEKDFLAAAVECAEASGLSFLSIYLQPECRTFAERVLVPYARALFFCGASPAGNPNALFSGQCLLVRREPYLFVGGHGAVISQLIEDVKLSALAERHRLRLAVARGDHLGHVRLYQGFRGIWRGVERQAFRFMLVSPWIGISILTAAFAMALWLPLLAWLLVDRSWVAAGVVAMLPSVLLAGWYRSFGEALCAPLAIYGMLPVLARGLLSAVRGKQIVWKGRAVGAVS